MNDVVATFNVIAVRPDGERVDISAHIGRPEQAETGEWSCPVQLLPFHPQLPGIRGVDSFHAVWLACAFVLKLLQHFKADGAQLLNEDGSEFPLEAYAAGLDA